MIRELFMEDLSLWACLWQSTLFAVLGLLGSFLLRCRPARACQVLFIGMITAVLVPATSALVKHFELGLLTEKLISPPSVVKDIPAETSIVSTSSKSQTEEYDRVSGLELIEAGSGVVNIPWRLITMYGWMIAILILLGRLFSAFLSGLCLLRRSQFCGCEQIQRAAYSAKIKLGITKDLQVHSSKDVHSPVIWCWSSNPVLLVPFDVDHKIDWEGVISHELAHWRRWDHISGLIAELIVCILSWNPFLWWSKKQLLRLSEQACDDWVIASGQPCEDYAQSLLNFKPQKQVAFVPAVVHSKKGLAGRIDRIVEDKCSNPRIGGVWSLGVSILTICIALVTACAQTRPAELASVTVESQVETTESLHKAASDGDIKQVKLLISKSANVNEKASRGKTPLHCACEKGHIEVAKLFINHGAYVNATTSDAKKPLHYAAMSGDNQTVKLLLSKGADINAKDRDGRTPLFEAMKSTAAGRNEAIELLVSKGAKIPALHLAAYTEDIEKLKKCLQDEMDINSQDGFGCTVLHVAVNSGRKNIVEFLISKGANVDVRDAYCGVTPLYYAASHNYEDMANLLLENGADVNARDKNGYSLIYNGIWDHSIDAVKLLISKGANVNIKDDAGYTPLVYAIWENDKDMVELLIGKGADVNTEDNDGLTPYYWASMEGCKDLAELLTAKGVTPVSTIYFAARAGDLAKVKRLIEGGDDVNMKDRGAQTPLYAAVLANNNDVAKFLIAKGADVNIKDNVGRTPLELVILGRGKKSMVELLISKGADVNTKDKWGVTPLHAACVRGQTDVAELLISKGADLNTKITGGEAGFTPLHFGSFYGHENVVELLIAKGANIDAKDINNRTPLHEACLPGHRDVVELLIGGGVDMNAKDKDGQTALSLANKKGHTEIVELLKKHGAKE